MTVCRSCVVFLLSLVLASCASTPTPPAQAPAPAAPWSVDDHQLLIWSAVDRNFAQNRALEASGLTASERFLYVVSEKYATLLQIDPQNGYRTVAVALDVPPGSELEGVAWVDGTLLMCDEAHGAVWAVEIADEQAIADGKVTFALAARQVPVHGLEMEGGKVGFEGITADGERSVVHMVLERVYLPDEQCESHVYTLDYADGELSNHPAPVVVPLADCKWRIAGATMWEGRPLVIQSRYPGEEYLLVSIDTVSGDARTVLDITEFGRSLRGLGYGNNLEGIAIAPSGDLFMAGDNADVIRAENPLPPPADERTVFVRMPSTAAIPR